MRRFVALRIQWRGSVVLALVRAALGIRAVGEEDLLSNVSSIRFVIALVGCAAVDVSAAASAAAAQVEASADAEARARFEAGRIAFAAARYEDALVDFEHAYRLSERPELLYNIAQCHDRLRHDAEAIEALEGYLAGVPSAENRVEVETRLAALREAEARRAALVAAASPAPMDTAPASGVETEWWFWTLIGVAVVGAGVGIGVGVAASSPAVAPPIPGDVGPGGVVMALGTW